MSRYYDAVTHRFINADGYFQAGTSILDGNTFAYCANNPVSRADTGGDSWFSDIAATVVESALTAMAAICPWMGSNSSTSVSHTSETKLINSDYAPVNFRCGEKLPPIYRLIHIHWVRLQHTIIKICIAIVITMVIGTLA